MDEFLIFKALNGRLSEETKIKLVTNFFLFQFCFLNDFSSFLKRLIKSFGSSFKKKNKNEKKKREM